MFWGIIRVTRAVLSDIFSPKRINILMFWVFQAYEYIQTKHQSFYTSSKNHAIDFSWVGVWYVYV